MQLALNMPATSTVKLTESIFLENIRVIYLSILLDPEPVLWKYL